MYRCAYIELSRHCSYSRIPEWINKRQITQDSIVRGMLFRAMDGKIRDGFSLRINRRTQITNSLINRYLADQIQFSFQRYFIRRIDYFLFKTHVNSSGNNISSKLSSNFIDNRLIRKLDYFVVHKILVPTLLESSRLSRWYDIWNIFLAWNLTFPFFRILKRYFFSFDQK